MRSWPHRGLSFAAWAMKPEIERPPETADDAPGPALDYTQVARGEVFKAGRLAAHLERVGEYVSFRYTDGWIAAGGPAVATTLPVREEVVMTAGGAVPAFFAGLLPEGRRLSALRRSVKTSTDDELSLLLAVGSDTIGDVTLLPEGHRTDRAHPRLEVDDFSSVRFADLLADLDIHIDRVALPGVQDKVSLAMLNVPVTAAGRSYLLKLDPPEFPHLVTNESFFLGAARKSGIRAAEAELVHDAEGRPGLVVRRFDRTPVKGGAGHPLAVEDGCQVLGLHPASKYRVTTEALLAKLSSLCEAPLPAAQVFVSHMVFAYVTGNGDAHAKNFSILADAHGRWGPAPAYDVPTSQPYGDNFLALSVAGKRDGNIPGRRFVELGVALGLNQTAARRAVDRIVDSVDLWLPGLGELPFDRGRLDKLRRVINRRRDLLRP